MRDLEVLVSYPYFMVAIDFRVCALGTRCIKKIGLALFMEELVSSKVAPGLVHSFKTLNFRFL